MIPATVCKDWNLLLFLSNCGACVGGIDEGLFHEEGSCPTDILLLPLRVDMQRASAANLASVTY